MRASASRLTTKLTVPANVEAAGRTIFGNWIWRMSPVRFVTEIVASLRVVLNHFQGRIAANRKSGKSGVARRKMMATRTT
jgi:hypothetical protein